MSKITNGGLTRSGTGCSIVSCTHMATVGVKGLKQIRSLRRRQIISGNVIFVEGLIDLEMTLSDEPPLGDWTIRAVISGQQKSRHFTVKEYGKRNMAFVCFSFFFYYIFFWLRVLD